MLPKRILLGIILLLNFIVLKLYKNKNMNMYQPVQKPVHSLYIYIYMFVCVCVCVNSVWTLDAVLKTYHERWIIGIDDES